MTALLAIIFGMTWTARLSALYTESLQAAGAEVGTVTFLDADAASEMRQYISHSHIELHVEVCLHYERTAYHTLHKDLRHTCAVLQSQDDVHRMALVTQSQLRACHSQQEQGCQDQAQDAANVFTAPVETLLETPLNASSTGDDDNSTGAHLAERAIATWVS
jgi:hypothetical protein